MKKVAQNNGLSLCIAKVETSDIDSALAFRIYDKVQQSVDADLAVIYNGNDETVHVPFMSQIRNMHPDFVRSSPDFEGEFEGWENASHLMMIDGDKCDDETFVRLVCDSNFSDEICKCWTEIMKVCCERIDVPNFVFGAAAIRVTLKDDSWFEYIIEGKKMSD